MVDHLVRTSVTTAGKPVTPQNRCDGRVSHQAAFMTSGSTRSAPLRVDEGGRRGLASSYDALKGVGTPHIGLDRFPVSSLLSVEEPGGDGQDTWYVRYLLQANHDPSLLIPAEDAWKGSHGQLFKEDHFNAREYLLLSLGQASGICPHIETSLRTSTPSGYELDATGAYEFLTQKALMLEQSGFGVMLPAWWTRKGTKLRLTARANVKPSGMQGVSGLSLDQIVQFDWEVALGGERLSVEELQRLAKLKAPLIKVRGQWVQINAEEIQAALQFWKKKGPEETTVRDVIRMALGGEKVPGNIPLEGIMARGWIADLLAELDGRIPFQELSPPEGFQGTLRPYQVRGYSWLGFLRKWGLGACLADDMGLGKTIQALALIQRDWQSGDRRPVLLICPTSVVSNWQKEAGRFTPGLPVMVHHGIERTKGEDIQKEAAAAGHRHLQLCALAPRF